MASLNRVFLIGNLTRDPELRYTPSGMAVANLRLAINHRFKDRSGELKQDTCFITVIVWDKQAESCNQYLQKGRLIFVEGRLQSRSWKDNEGKNRSVIDIRADRVVFLGGGSGQKKDGGFEGKDSMDVTEETAKPAPVNENDLDEVSWPQDTDEQLS